MRTKVLQLLLFAGLIAIQSCIAPASMTSAATEAYIKTQVETHSEADFSSIRTYSVFTGPTVNGGYLEFTGYKYQQDKNLVISATDKYVARAPGKRPQAQGKMTFMQITLAQARQILENYQKLEQKIKAERPAQGETIYHDFTVSEHLFISYSRTAGTNSNMAVLYIHLWIEGSKYSLQAAQVIRPLNDFVNY